MADKFVVSYEGGAISHAEQDDFPPYAGIYSGDRIADRTRGEVRQLRAEVERLKRALALVSKAGRADNEDNERLRMALTCLVELGEDDGSAPDDAWKTAFEQAANLLGRAKK